MPFRIIIGWPSSLRQVIRGGGWPVALHHNVAFSPSDTERSPLVSSYTISGGTGRERKTFRLKQDGLWDNAKRVNINLRVVKATEVNRIGFGDGLWYLVLEIEFQERQK